MLITLSTLSGQEKIPVFSTSGLQFYYIGWSPEGILAAVYASRPGTDSSDILFQLVLHDTVTDELVFSSAPEKGRTVQGFYGLHRDQFDILLKKYRVVPGKADFYLKSFSAYNADFNLKITPGIKGSGRTSSGQEYFKEMKVLISSSRGDHKTVYHLTASDEAPYLVNMELKGILISPHEKRTAVICAETLVDAAGHEVQRYRTIGAHLTLGFTRNLASNHLLIESVLNGQLYVTRMLVEEDGLDIHVRDARGYPLTLLAARNGKWAICRQLVEYGADISSVDNRGRTVLHYAAESGKKELCRYLLDKGADPGILDKNSAVPGDLARSRGFRELARLLGR